MRVTGSRVYSRPAPVPKMPPGLVELMEGLTKDVLKHNPPDVYEFCAEHMQKLLEIRDGPSTKKPVSLEQKILRAQEKVKKRAEERWQKFKEEYQQKEITENFGKKSFVNKPNLEEEIMTETMLKPVHQDHDLTQTSEIEIFCVPDDTATSVNEETDDKSRENVTKVEDTSIPVAAKDVSRDVACSLNAHKEAEDEKLIQEIAATDLNAATEAEENGNSGEKTDGHENITETTQDENAVINNDNPTYFSNMKSNNDHNMSAVLENEIKIDEVSDSENTIQIDIQECPTFELETGDIELVNREIEIEDDSLPEYVKKSTEVESVEISDSKEGTGCLTNTDDNELVEDDNKLVIDYLNNENVKETVDDNSEKDIDSLNNEDVKEIITDVKYIVDSVSNDKTEQVESNNELAENVENFDLEKTLNEAIEKVKRKDSSTNDYLDGVNALHGEESDASDCSLLDDNNTGVKPAEEKSLENNSKLENHNNHNLIQSDMLSDIKEADENNTIPDNQEQIINDTPQIEGTDVKVFPEQCDDSEFNNKNDIVDEGVSKNSDESTKCDNPNTMDLETAAVTIQKVFRTFLFKSRASTFEDAVNEDTNLSDEDEKKDDRQYMPNNMNKDRRTLGISRMDTVLQTVNEEKSLSLSTDDSSLSSAATIIQAHVRGFLVRNKLNSGKTASSNSLVISNEPSSTSMDGEADQNKSKTILNIHIVPEGGNYLSRDESMITSMDLSLDGSPPSSVNLHPLGYNTSERRKLLKREDAVQSVSPPSNNSGKLSEDVDSIKELTINENESTLQKEQVSMASLIKDDSHLETEVGSLETTPTNSLTIETVLEDNKTSNTELMSSPEPITESSDHNKRSLTKQSSDELDVVTPYKELSESTPRDESQKLLHSGEFHDIALPTKVSRSDTPVVSEFKNVLVYFLLWNNS